MSNTMNYFLKDIMAKTKINMSNWCLEDFLKNKELVGVAYARFDKNKKIYPVDTSLKNKVGAFIHIGAARLAGMPTQFKIKDVYKIFEKYNVNNNYYDFSCGWAARMLASLAKNVNYFGTDPNFLLVERLNKIFELYKELNEVKSNIDIRISGSETFQKDWEGKIGLAFSSPPYFDCEKYNVGKQSYIEGETSYEDWLNNYLAPTIENIYRYLIKDGYFVINIKNFNGKDLADKTIDFALKNKFKFIGTETLKVCHRPSTDYFYKNNEKLTSYKPDEDIFVFSK